ncbi:MAG TPA: STAS domain-containing protein [Solirubrobacteraceae bacterium]|nr:STAS domain-containing protein [Solirubrobacteraceae bacterium]
MSAQTEDRLGGVAQVPEFACSWSTGGAGTAWVRVSGELDIATTSQLETALGEAQAQARLVALDLRELSFIDSYGVYAIVAASVAARRVGSRLVLLRGRPSVDRVFALAGVGDEVEIGDIRPGEPPVQVLLALAGSESSR